MPLQHARAAVLAAGLFIAGAVGAWWTGQEFLVSAKRLLSYLHSNKPPVISDDADLNRHLGLYLFDPNYSVHFINTGNASLAAPLRRKTVQHLGTTVLRDQPQYDERNASLPVAFRAYLLDRLSLLGLGLQPREKATWISIVDQVEDSLGRTSSNDYAEARIRAEAFLQNSKLPSELKKAQNLFRLYENNPHPGDQSFFVGTQPGADRFDFLILSAPSTSTTIVLDRAFHLSIVGNGESLGMSKARISRVFQDVPFLRPWFVEDLVDDNVKLLPEMKVKHFGNDGALRIVPTSLVLFLGLDIVFELSEPLKAEQLASAARDNLCCVLKSDDLSISLEPSSVRKIGELRYRGRTVASEPRVAAVISKRRLPK